MSEPIAPSEGAAVTDWLANADDALTAVLEHAANVGEWGAIEWVVTILAAVKSVAFIGRFIPVVAPYAQAVDTFLPRLTGRREAAIQKKADKIQTAARTAVTTADEALDFLGRLNPELHDEVIAGAKKLQDDLGVRDEIRAILRGIREETPEK